jgi:hypothetical protein
MSTAQLKATSNWELLRLPLVAYGTVFGLYIAFMRGKFIWFSWHPLAMIVGFVTLSTNAALIKKIGGRDNTITHGYLNLAAAALAAFGWYVIHSNKNMQGKQHWTTLHGKMGFALMVTYIAAGLGGLAALHPDFGFLRKNNSFRLVHKWAGRVLAATSWIICVQGLLKVAPDNYILQAGFVLPLLFFGFFALL